MVIILNNTKKGENPLVLKPKYYTADGTEVTRQDASMATSANFDVECGENYRFTLMTASNPKIILAAAKRFLSGVSWLKCGATHPSTEDRSDARHCDHFRCQCSRNYPHEQPDQLQRTYNVYEWSLSVRYLLNSLVWVEEYEVPRCSYRGRGRRDFCL